VRPTRDLLPDLEARAQANVTFDRPLFDLFEPPPPPGESCFDSERNEHGARRCLRFDILSANAGEGPIELRFSRRAGETHDEPVFQRIYRSDGQFRDTPAGSVEFHPVHGHYHFTGFAITRLRMIDSHGRPVGGSPLRQSRKVSFCLADTAADRWALKGDAPLSYPAPNCLEPVGSANGRELFRQGMSRGWGDKYDWFLPDQYVEVSGVGDGTYVMETIMDPENRIAESDDGNNTVSACVRLTRTATATPHAELVGTPPCR